MKWLKPNEGQVKLNCDATVQPSHSILAAVYRDYTGELLMAAVTKLSPMSSNSKILKAVKHSDRPLRE